MTEIPFRNAGETILSAFSNDLIVRTEQRYDTDAERTALSPAPGIGEPSWVDAVDEMSIFQSPLWVVYVDEQEADPVFDHVDASDAALDVFVAQAYSSWENDQIPIVEDRRSMGSVKVPFSGDYLFHGAATINTILASTTKTVSVAAQVDGSDRGSWRVNSSLDDESLSFSGVFVFEIPLKSLTAGHTVSFDMWRSADFTAGAAERFCWITGVPKGRFQ